MLPCLRAGTYRLAACVLNITSRMLVLHCADSYKKSGMHPFGIDREEVWAFIGSAEMCVSAMRQEYAKQRKAIQAHRNPCGAA